VCELNEHSGRLLFEKQNPAGCLNEEFGLSSGDMGPALTKS